MKRFLKTKISIIYRAVVAVVLAAVFAMSTPFVSSAFANEAEQISFASYQQDFIRRIDRRALPTRAGTAGLAMVGELPRISGTGAAVEALNARFIAQFDEFLQAHRARATRLEFTYEIFIAGPLAHERYVSVVIYMTAIGANTTRSVATTVIDVTDLSIITLNDFEANVLRLISNSLVATAQANPRLHNSNFNGINNSHPFYFDGNNIEIPFASGAFTVAHREVTTPRTFPIAAFAHHTIAPNRFIALPQEQYSTIMVNLSYAINRFDGYTAAWSASTQTVNIWRGGSIVSSVTVGVNSYFYGNPDNARTLELAPILADGSTSRVMVPLSFFREIMGMATTVTSEGIIISRFDTRLIPSEQENVVTGNTTITAE